MTEDGFETKELNLKAYWAMVVRERWCLLGPLFLLGLLSFVVAHFWPVLYRSEALILVEQQKVPEQYVTANVTSDLQDRLQSITQQILSHTRLQKLIEQFNLYANLRARMAMDEVIDKMREDIRIELVQAPRRQEGLTAFRIYYSAGNPRVAQQVTNELTSLFIEENLEARTQQSVSTTNFLENQLEQARKDLAEQEERLREYKVRFLGELPEQQQSNVQILSSLEAQLHAVSAAREGAERQQIYLESLRAEYQAMQNSLAAPGSETPAGPVAVADRALQDLRKQLTDLEAQYTSNHPDIDRVKEAIAQWEVLRQHVVAEHTPDAEGGIKTTPPEGPASAEMESRLKVTRLEIASDQREIDELRKQIEEFQSRLKLTPLREQQLSEVTRNYENSREYYQSLLQKKLQSELATNLEKREQGEQFRIIDPPSLPQKPVEPNRLEIILIGWVAGLCCGLALTAAREITSDILCNEEEIQKSAQLPILVRLPVLRSPREESRRKWRLAGEVAAVTLLILLSAAAGVYAYMAS
jgi:succinoglycan biosynthesis transport protein ExoP